MHDDAASDRPTTEEDDCVHTDGAFMLTIGAGSSCNVTVCSALAWLTPSEMLSLNVVRLEGSSSGDKVSSAPLFDTAPIAWPKPMTVQVKFNTAVAAKPKDCDPSSVNSSVAQRPTDVGPVIRTVGLAAGGRLEVCTLTHCVEATAPVCRVVRPEGHGEQAEASEKLAAYEPNGHATQEADEDKKLPGAHKHCVLDVAPVVCVCRLLLQAVHAAFE